ncbi:hypothetical protein [Streptomyces triculaminicus]|uniref:hypothetical protein n=1 Tax=Streptomyces triculaminicus TaxID=2816232 RepID=UPI0037953EC0
MAVLQDPGEVAAVGAHSLDRAASVGPAATATGVFTVVSSSQAQPNPSGTGTPASGLSTFRTAGQGEDIMKASAAA